EGTDRFGGEVRWDTDRYGDPSKTFDNYDRFTFGFGGPTPIKNLTYFATYEGSFQDTYLKSSMTKRDHTLLDFIQFGFRQSNQINTNFKLAYRANPRNKFTLETINNHSIQNPYFATHGDVPRYLKRDTGTLTLKSDFSTRKIKQHSLKTGLEVTYNRVQNLALTQPNVENDGLPGATRSSFLNYNPEGAAYF